jgi:hypothetical protein
MGLLCLFRAAAAGVVLLAGCLAGALPTSAQDTGKLVAEARELFKAVDRGTIGRCKFERAWDSRPMLAATVQRHLRLTVHADLVVSEPPATPMEVIDPAGRKADAFCTQAEREAVRQEALTALRDGGVVRFMSVSYGFPIFDRGFTRAALMVQSNGIAHHRTPGGKTILTINAAGGAEIYAKRGGKWTRVDYDSYYTAH